MLLFDSKHVKCLDRGEKINKVFRLRKVELIKAQLTSEINLNTSRINLECPGDRSYEALNVSWIFPKP
jgi:hypothetical protein